MYLNEATLLNNVRIRYTKDKIYVSTCNKYFYVTFFMCLQFMCLSVSLLFTVWVRCKEDLQVPTSPFLQKKEIFYFTFFSFLMSVEHCNIQLVAIQQSGEMEFKGSWSQKYNKICLDRFCINSYVNFVYKQSIIWNLYQDSNLDFLLLYKSC